MLIVMNYLSSCAQESCKASIMPEFPKAGIKVADELQKLSAENYPNLWEWIGRLNKLRQELDTQH